ncbi:MAG: DUF4984 domain-containing protein [Bacteroides sp.]|nr:DUF4984 domain-containing protein [Bacteroides sp.]
MKKLFIGIAAACALMISATGCEEERTTYSGPNYIAFSDTLYELPVQNSEDYYDIPVVATQTSDQDRTLAVEIIDKSSNAIEGKHYALESNTITIKAGERVANVRVRGIYENIGVSDSLGFALRLVTPEDTHWSLYGIDAKVVLIKRCPFDINEFTGYCVLTSTYFYSYMTSTDLRLIQSEVDPDNENTIILKNYFYDGYDVKVKFTTDDLWNPLIETEDQVFGPTDEAFGTIYGNGKIMMSQPSSVYSYYSSCEHFILQYMTLRVDNVGTVGTFVNAVEWISDDEAEKLKREGY